jgi:signal transduction histidine kinase
MCCKGCVLNARRKFDNKSTGALMTSHPSNSDTLPRPPDVLFGNVAHNSRMAKMWQTLIRPHPTLVGAEERRRAQFLAGSLVFLIPVALVGVTAANIVSPPVSANGMVTAMVMVGVVVALVGIYFLSRTRYYAIASAALVTILFTGSVGLSLFDTEEAITLIPFLALVTLVASLLFSERTTLNVGMVSMVAAILTLYANDQRISNVEQDVIVFVLIMTVLIIAAAFIRTQYITKIEFQKEQLDIARATLEQRVEDRTRQLRERNEELRRFAYILSHDLRNHLVNFSGFTQELQTSVELVKDGVRDLLPHAPEKDRAELAEAFDEDIPEFLGIIDTSVGQMKRMVDAMLELARQENRTLNLKHLNMNAIVNDVLVSLSTEIKQNDVTVHVKNLPDVVADQFAIERIFTNLIHNAVIYAEPTRKSEITIGGERGHRETTFYVQDNGIGIHEDDVHAVFDIFKRVGTSNVSGSGMGLAFVRNLAQKHGGTVRCDSLLGLGSKFTFSIGHDLDKRDEDMDLPYA